VPSVFDGSRHMASARRIDTRAMVGKTADTPPRT
jgi:hypothetical protein